MKGITLKVVINEGKIVTQREFIGFDSRSISDQLEILGIMENLKDIQKESISVLAKKKK